MYMDTYAGIYIFLYIYIHILFDNIVLPSLAIFNQTIIFLPHEMILLPESLKSNNTCIAISRPAAI